MKFSFAKSNVRKLLWSPLWSILFLLAKLSPRTNRLWVFGRNGMFGDGARYLMEYVHENHPDITCVWLTNSPSVRDEVRGRGMRSELIGTARGWYCALRARVGVVCMGLGDVNRLAAGGMRIVQLWHGSPLKRIGLDTSISFEIGRSSVGLLIQRAVRFCYHIVTAQYALVIAPSDMVRQRYSSAFGVTVDRIVVTGDPRADVILGGHRPEDSAASLQRMRERYGIPPGDLIVLYAPTWRESKTLTIFPDELNSEALNNVLRQANAWMLIRAHRADGQERQDSRHNDRLLAMSNADFPDVNYLLTGVDILVSDYSAIIMDFALLKRPIVFYAPDLDEYDATRGLYEDYREFTGGMWVRDWDGLTLILQTCLAGQTRSYREHASRIAARYTTVADTENCRRVFEAIRQRFMLS